jgi:hypothetical protein
VFDEKGRKEKMLAYERLCGVFVVATCQEQRDEGS